MGKWPGRYAWGVTTKPMALPTLTLERPDAAPGDHLPFLGDLTTHTHGPAAGYTWDVCGRVYVQRCITRRSIHSQYEPRPDVLWFTY